ncbi:MAG: SpaA isopeptide-forming pilin-related protein [Bacteroidales bacterium]|nr:SpaA isopeptide-forming pilin-related protein [Clostridium sp.]MCM1203630.1 SpaA isopeptide-forming pilin-related protein [Bacteroidales bacterium]
MKNKRQRWTALLLAVVLAFNLFSHTAVTVSAAEIENTEEISTEVYTENTEEMNNEAATEALTAESTEEQPEEAGTETVAEELEEEPAEESASEEAVTEASTETVITEEEPAEKPGLIINELEADDRKDKKEEMEALVDESLLSPMLSGGKPIYSSGQWSYGGQSGNIWYTYDDYGNTVAIFCLNHGASMSNGVTGELVASAGGNFSAYAVSAAMNYYSSHRGNASAYAVAQLLIWNMWNVSEETRSLYNEITYGWSLVEANGGRAPGGNSYSSRLTAVSSGEIRNKKAAFAGAVKNNAKVTKLPGADAGKYEYSSNYNFTGTAWRYFAQAGYISAEPALYTLDGEKYGKSSVVRQNNGSFTISTDITAGEAGSSEDNPLFAVFHLTYGALGSYNYGYLATSGNKQNMTYSAGTPSTGYWIMPVYHEETPAPDGSPVYVIKRDEFGKVLEGVTLKLTGESGEAAQYKYANKHSSGTPRQDALWMIKREGTFRLEEVRPNSSQFSTIAESDKKWIRFRVTKDNDGKYHINVTQKNGMTVSVTQVESGDNKGCDKLVWEVENTAAEGGVAIHKVGKVLSGYNRSTGEFTYTTAEMNVNLEGVTFQFYAAEDININGTAVFKKDENIPIGASWGKGHEVERIKGDLLKDDKTGIVTGTDGVVEVWGLPVGNYYVKEIRKNVEGFTDTTASDTITVPFTVTRDATAAVSFNDTTGTYFANQQKNINVYVEKVDLYTGKIKKLPGAEFTLYADVNNVNYFKQPIFTREQTVPAVVGRDLDKKTEKTESGTWVPIRKVITSDDGNGLFDNLPYGTYLLVETRAPLKDDGTRYELAESSVKFTFSLDGGAADVVKQYTNKEEEGDKVEEGDTGFEISYEMWDIEEHHPQIRKNIETAEPLNPDEPNMPLYLYEDVPGAGAVFGIYAAEDIKNTRDEVVYHTGDEIGTCTTDETGTATYDGVMYQGSYYFKELKTPDDTRYKLDTAQYPFTVSYNSSDVLNEEPVINTLYKGSLKVLKTDGESGRPLPGVEFVLLDEKAEVLGSFVTDDKGEIRIENLPVGTYYLRETKTLEDYLLDSTERKIELTAEDLDQVEEVKNYRLKTVALAKDTGEHITMAGEHVEITDTVTYNGLPMGKLKFVTSLKTKDAGGSVTGVTGKDGKPVMTENIVEITRKAGEITVDLPAFDARPYAGKTVTVYQDIYTMAGERIGGHTDIDSEEQSIHFPRISTTAADKDGGKTVRAGGEVTLVDKIRYENLLPGRKYTVSGVVMDKTTGSPLLVNGKKVTASAEFTPSKGDGETEASFTFSTKGLGNRELVVFETLKLYGAVVAVHQDMEDEGQTVKVLGGTSISIRTNSRITGHGGVKTGDGFILMLTLLFMLAAAVPAMMHCIECWQKLKPAGHAGRRKPKGGKKKKKGSSRRAGYILLLGLAVVLGAAGITGYAAGKIKDLPEKELQDTEYKGKVYTYALQKKYETDNPEEEITFEEKKGMKLQEVDYQVIKTVPQTKEVEETRDYRKLKAKDESKIKDAITIDGQAYQLKEVKWEEIPNRETVSYTLDLGYAGSAPDYPETYEYTYTSPATRKETTVQLPFKRLETGACRWVDGFSATATFHNLEGEVFCLGNHAFSYNADSLSLTGEDYAELVRMLGYDTAKYRLDSAAWSGEPYQTETGEWCRNAVVSGQQYAASYQAVYEDEVENGKLYTAHAVYSTEVELPPEEAPPVYVMQATGYYKETGVWTNIITFVTQHKAASVGIAISLVAVLAVAVMVIMVLRRRKAIKGGDEESN